MLCPVCQSPNVDDARFCASCGSPLPAVEAAPNNHVLQPRTALRGGAFVIEELLGAGGFGLTYRARESALGREVAIKEFFPFGTTRQEERIVPPPTVAPEDWRRELSAFREEALTLARFSHPAIVRAYAVWGEGGTAYFAMEFLRGQSLQKRLDSGKPLPVDEALAIVERVGEALALVHEAGLLHRDIKPDNILLCDGRTVLIDFGTAREFAADKTTPMTQLLTPGYAPLEQYGRRARFGPFTDVYALAATLYHALSGTAPPPAPDRAAGVELRPLDEVNPRVSPRLARAVEAAMEVSVPKRPQTVSAWLASLREAQKPVAETPRPTAPVAVPAPITPAQVPAPTPIPQSASPFPAAGTTFPALTPSPRPAYPGTGLGPRPGRAPVGTVYPDAPPIAPDARVPSWVWALLVAVPLLLFGFWVFYDPARGDLRAFDNRLSPVLVHSDGVKDALKSLNIGNMPNIETVAFRVGTNVVPLQQKLLGELQSLKANSDEALFSRDQLMDAEKDMLGALQGMADATDENEMNTAFESMKRADGERMVWKADYNYLLHQHGVK